MIYLIVFFSSFLFIKLGNRIEKNKKRVIALIFYGIGLLIPAILAGIRDYTIGTDVMVYGNAWFDRAVDSSNLRDYIHWGVISQVGVGYLLLNYLVAIVSDNPHVFYFVLALVINILIFKGVHSCKEYINIDFAMLIFFLLFYNNTLNLLRQSLAIAIIMSGFGYVINKKLFKYIIVVVFAGMTHSTAFLGILIYFIYNIQFSKYRSLVKTGIICALLGCIVLYQGIVSFLVSKGIILSRYGSYSDVQTGGGKMVRICLFCLPAILLFYFVYKKVKKDIWYNFGGMILLFSTFLSVLLFVNSIASRIAMYFDIYYIVLIPVFAKRVNLSTGKNRVLVKNYSQIFLGIFYVFYWWMVYVYQGQAATYPFLLFTK